MASSPPLLPILLALAEPTRLAILQQLAHGECCVCDLGSELEVEQSLLSHHLRTLRKARLVSVRREGRWAHYSLNRESLGPLEALLEEWRDPTGREPEEACCSSGQACCSTHREVA